MKHACIVRIPFIVALSTCLSLQISITSAYARVDDLKPASSETLVKFKEIYRTLKASYETCHGAAINQLPWIENGKPSVGLSSRSLDFYRVPGRLRIDTHTEDNVKLDGERTKGWGVSSLWNEQGSHYKLHRDKLGGPFLLDRVEAANQKNLQLMNQSFLHAFDCPYSAGPLDLAEFLDDPQCKLFEPTEVEKDGRKLIRLTIGRGEKVLNFETSKGGVLSYFTTVLIDPEMNHVVLGYSAVRTTTRNQAKKYFSGSAAYEKNPSGPPTPKSVVWEEFAWEPEKEGEPHRLGAGEEVVAVQLSRAIMGFTSFDFVPTPETEFALTAFGLPDIAFPPPAAADTKKSAQPVDSKAVGTTNVPIVPAVRNRFDARWLFALAGVSFFLAIGFKIYSSRSRSAPTTPLGNG